MHGFKGKIDGLINVVNLVANFSLWDFILKLTSKIAISCVYLCKLILFEVDGKIH